MRCALSLTHHRARNPGVWGSAPGRPTRDPEGDRLVHLLDVFDVEEVLSTRHIAWRYTGCCSVRISDVRLSMRSAGFPIGRS